MQVGQYSTDFTRPAERPDGAAEPREKTAGRRSCRCQDDGPRSHEGARAWRSDETNPGRPGRRHVRRSLMHLARDIRHQVRDEIRDLRVSGEADAEKIAAVKEAYRDFRSSLKDVFHAAGRGRDFDPAGITDGVAEAMRSFTEALQVINGTVPEADGTAAPDPATDPAAPQTAVPDVAEPVPPVAADTPVGASSITVRIGIVIDFAA